MSRLGGDRLAEDMLGMLNDDFSVQDVRDEQDGAAGGQKLSTSQYEELRPSRSNASSRSVPLWQAAGGKSTPISSMFELWA